MSSIKSLDQYVFRVKAATNFLLHAGAVYLEYLILKLDRPKKNIYNGQS